MGPLTDSWRVGRVTIALIEPHPAPMPGRAVNPAIRNSLAIFLHDRHPRTAHPLSQHFWRSGWTIEGCDIGTHAADRRATSLAARRWRNTLHHSSGFSRRPMATAIAASASFSVWHLITATSPAKTMKSGPTCMTRYPSILFFSLRSTKNARQRRSFLFREVAVKQFQVIGVMLSNA
jgi:hypothetical protein